MRFSLRRARSSLHSNRAGNSTGNRGDYAQGYDPSYRENNGDCNPADSGQNGLPSNRRGNRASNRPYCLRNSGPNCGESNGPGNGESDRENDSAGNGRSNLDRNWGNRRGPSSGHR